MQSIAGTSCCQARVVASLMLLGFSAVLEQLAGTLPPRLPKARGLFPRAGHGEGRFTDDWKSSGVPRS